LFKRCAFMHALGERLRFAICLSKWRVMAYAP